MLIRNQMIMPALFATLGTLVLSLTYLYLYIRERHRYLFVWFLAWVFIVIRFLLVILTLDQANRDVSLSFSYLLNLMTTIFLLLGVLLLRNQKITLRFWLFFLPFAVWIPLTPLVGLSLNWNLFPTFLVIGTINIYIGLSFIRQREATKFIRWGIGLSMIIWGIHKLDYPFVYQDSLLMILGFYLGLFLELVVSIGLILLNYEINQNKLKAMQHSYRVQEERYRNLVETTHDMIWEVNLLRRYTYISPRVEAVLGYPAEEMIGKSVYGLMPPQEGLRIREIVRSAVKNCRPFTGLISHHVHRDGHLVTLESNGLPFFDQKGRLLGYRGSDRDISERISADEERQKIEQRLHQTEKMQALGQMAGGVAHDFNNQLAGILGYAELCRDECDHLPLAREYISQIIAASQRSADLIDQLLAFARKSISKQETFAIHTILEEVMGLLKRSVNKKILLRTEYKAHSDTVYGDRSQLHNALLNIALNGSDAMPDGGTLTLKTANSRNSKTIMITISDTGIGMSRELQSRILEPFFTTKPTGKGVGMGLPAAYGSIQKHGGELHIDSQPNKGSHFRITLPLSQVAQTAPIESQDTLGHQTTPGNTLRILVVDDEESVLNMEAKILAHLGHHPIVFHNPYQALEYFQSHHMETDLIISDLMMPDLNGIELLTRMQQIKPDLKGIISSGYGEYYDNQTLQQLNLISLRKPFSMKALKIELSKLFSSA